MEYLYSVKNSENKYGFKDAKDNIVIDYKYDKVDTTFGFGVDRTFEIVGKDNLYGVIDKSGKEVVPIRYYDIIILFDDLFAVRTNIDNNDWRFGVINSTGEIIIPFKYKYISHIKNFISCYSNVKSETLYSHKRNNGFVYNYDICDKEEHFYNFKSKYLISGHGIDIIHDYLLIKKNEKLGVLDINGNVILSFDYDEIKSPIPDRFIVRKNTDNDWSVGVVNEKNETIIDFCYKYIYSEEGSFYQCYKESDSYIDNEGNNHVYKYKNYNKEYWYNNEGLYLLEGEATVLSNYFIAVYRNDKVAVFDINGSKIINYIYDSAKAIDDKIIVAKDQKIGILNKNGNVIINCSYNTIKCINLKNKYDGYTNYGIYNKDVIFDTENKSAKKKLYENRISYINDSIRISFGTNFDFDKFFILENDSHSEIFSIYEGILYHSCYSKILELSNYYFVVQKNGLWGLYDTEYKEEILPCIYERIQNWGTYIILLNIGNLWGVYDLFGGKEPQIKFLDIKPLDDDEQYFSAKIEYDDTEEDFTNLNEENFYYSIIDRNGDILPGMENLRGRFTSHFKYYSRERILAEECGQYGFVDITGYISIPLKYDEISERKDGKFNVRIDERWGVLNINGSELPYIKYTKKLPENLNNLVVQDYYTERYGILDINGNEKVPSIYENLNFIKNRKVIEFKANTKWGCLSNDGKILINALYDDFIILNDYILGCNRIDVFEDLCYINEGKAKYIIKKDLYDLDGTLLLGGFSQFKQSHKRGLYLFQFGKIWIRDVDINDWGGHVKKIYADERISDIYWLVLKKDFSSVIKDRYGNHEIFNKGYVFESDVFETVDDEIICDILDVPSEILSKKEPFFSHNMMICGNKYSDQYVVRIEDGACSNKYDDVEIIDDDIFFFTFSSPVDMVSASACIGKITEDGKEELLIDFYDGNCYLTYPKDGFIFGVSNSDKEGHSTLLLYNINDESFEPITAIKNIETKTLVENIEKGYLLFDIKEEEEGTKRLLFSDILLFDDSFKILISKIQEPVNNTNKATEKKYWYEAIDSRQKACDAECFDDEEDDDDDYDYDDAKELTWDALTDGQYGDMPDGFDNDYSFLGY